MSDSDHRYEIVPTPVSILMSEARQWVFDNQTTEARSCDHYNLHHLFVKHETSFPSLLDYRCRCCGQKQAMVLPRCLRFATMASLLTRTATIDGRRDGREGPYDPI
ncbi:hypothetical protein SESBI_12559 [Sesbania bispinosa]|nr:hypothetical protein SESBI_12559 [Sesbania bispinosa]